MSLETGQPEPAPAEPVVDANAQPAVDPAPADPAPAEPAAEPDWRSGFGEDEALQSFLGRFNDQQSFGKTVIEQQKMLRERNMASPPGEDATDDHRAAWNEARGIPESADGYKIEYQPNPDLVEEADSAVLQAITEEFHGKGGLLADPSVVETMHQKYYEIKETQMAAFSEADKAASAKNVEDLKTSMGSDFTTNLALAKAHLATHSGLEQTQLDGMLELSVIGPDGKPMGKVGDQPWLMKLLSASARASGEDKLFNLAGGMADASSIDDQIKAIKAKRLGTPDERAEYAQLSAPGGKLSELNKLKLAQQKRQGS